MSKAALVPIVLSMLLSCRVNRSDGRRFHGTAESDRFQVTFCLSGCLSKPQLVVECAWKRFRGAECRLRHGFADRKSAA